jgi:NitT/TauT family transport system substrate-binding protein
MFFTVRNPAMNKICFMTFILGVALSLVFTSAIHADKLRVAFPVLGVALSPSWVTFEKRIWKKHGLDVELILLSGGGQMVPALVSGSVQVLLASDVAVTQAIAQGINLTKLGVTTNSLGASLLTHPSIHSIQDLKGKVLGITRGRDAAYFRLVKILGENGIDPNQVKFLPIAGSPMARLNLLKTGVIQGTVVSPPLDLLGTREGLRLASKVDIPTPGGGISVTSGYLKQNRDLLLRFLKGYIEGIHYLLTHKEESMKVFSHYYRNRDMTTMAYFYDAISGRVERELRPNAESVRFLTDLVAMDEPKAKLLTEKAHWDLSLIEEVRQSGFVEQLYKK